MQIYTFVPVLRFLNLACYSTPLTQTNTEQPISCDFVVYVYAFPEAYLGGRPLGHGPPLWPKKFFFLTLKKNWKTWLAPLFV